MSISWKKICTLTCKCILKWKWNSSMPIAWSAINLSTAPLQILLLVASFTCDLIRSVLWSVPGKRTFNDVRQVVLQSYVTANSNTYMYPIFLITYPIRRQEQFFRWVQLLSTMNSHTALWQMWLTCSVRTGTFLLTMQSSHWLFNTWQSWQLTLS